MNEQKIPSVGKWTTILSFIIYCLLISCQNTETYAPSTIAVESSIDTSAVVHQEASSASNNTQEIKKELLEDEAYQLIINHLISKGVASSCSFLPNNMPKDNISIFDRAKAYSSPEAYGSFQGVSPKQLYYFWHIAIKVCETGELGAISYGTQDWGIIQDGKTGEVLNDFSTFRQGVNTYMTKALYQLSGVAQIDNSVNKNDNINENLYRDVSFPGGEREWMNFYILHLEQNIDAIKKDGRSGNLVILINIDKDGSVNEVRAVPCNEAGVSNCIPPESKLFEVIINAIFKGPKWEPAIVKGVAAKSQKRLIVPFYLNED